MCSQAHHMHCLNRRQMKYKNEEQLTSNHGPQLIICGNCLQNTDLTKHRPDTSHDTGN